MPKPNIYDAEFVEQLFTQMSSSYDRMNSITSFGFSIRWRRQCAAGLTLAPGMKVVDLLSGMGEVWPYILPKIGPKGSLLALDFCAAMTALAEQRCQQFPAADIKIIQEDALASSIPSGCADAVISTFGLKTFNADQLEQLAAEVWRILKPGGTFSMVEVSRPTAAWLRIPYLLYLRYFIPVLGKLFLGNPDNYRMLGVYTLAFGNCQEAKIIFERAGFEVEHLSYFGGCASGIRGRKPGYFN